MSDATCELPTAALGKLSQACETASDAVGGFHVVAGVHPSPCDTCGSAAVRVLDVMNVRNNTDSPQRVCGFCGDWRGR
ncbi:hypothetical protein GQS65_19040 [Halomarina oriensis]|uniref:Uncharacterized protein n=1 Tax=Halomarina oriensis TaxID=671145 RepID=A0A6B0GT69_9EURY|nr:hypothetical protein [Halomarina oriensis]